MNIERSINAMVTENRVPSVPATNNSKDSLKFELFLSNQIIDALSSVYHDVYFADLDTGQMRSYRCSRVTREKFGSQFEGGSFETNFYTYVRNAVHIDDQKLFEPVLTISGVRSLFKMQTTYGFKYRAVRNGEVHYCQARIVKLKAVSTGFVFAFKNIDKDHQLELDAHEQSKLKMQQGLHNFSNVIQRPLLEVDQLLETALSENVPERTRELIVAAKNSNHRLHNFIQTLLQVRVEDSELLEITLKQFESNK